MKSIFKSMSCLVLGAMIVTPMFAQQKKLYPELEGPGPVVIMGQRIFLVGKLSFKRIA